MTGQRLVLYDDAHARSFEPFSLSRPGGELRAGAELVRRRWETALGAPATGCITSPHLADFEEGDAPPVVTEGTVPAGSWIVNTRFAPVLTPQPAVSALQCGRRVAAARLRTSIGVDRLSDGTLTLEALCEPAEATAIDGWWLDDVWDLVRHLPGMLTADIVRLKDEVEAQATAGFTILGSHAVVVDARATVEPWVLFDASAGPILVSRGATLSAYTRLVGPCVVGNDSMVLGGKVGTSSIGDVCRVHGEVSHSIFVGHGNKAHDGFVGHSILGRWSNLGASTVTSNLKNTYGNVSLWSRAGERDTGMQFLGTLVGDHAKTAIGTRLMTGSVIGCGANVLFPGPAPRVVPPFAFKDGVWRPDKFIEVARRVMARRQVTLGERAAAHLRRVFDARWSVDP